MSAPLPTPEQIAKLPKWAQERMENLERRTRAAETALKDYLDNQTPSEFYTEDYVSVGEGSGTHVQKFIQTYKMAVEHDGVKLTILLRQDEKGIELQWNSTSRLMNEVALVPMSFNKVKIVAPEFMR
jgi:hypothetical protein